MSDVTLIVLSVIGLLVIGIVGAAWRLRRPSQSSTQVPVVPTTAVQLTGDLVSDVQQLVTRQKKIEAIKLVRDRTGLGLKEAKEYVEGLERGQPLPTPPLVPAVPPVTDLNGTVRQLVSQGKKLEAIKLVRNQTGMGLKEAKDYVEGL